MTKKRTPRRYHIKPLPVILLILILVLLALLIIWGVSSPDGDPAPSSDGSVSTETSSSPIISSLPESTPAISSAPSEGIPAGGEPESSRPASSRPAVSSKPPASIPNTPVTWQDPYTGPYAGLKAEEHVFSSGNREPDLNELPAGSPSDWNLILLNPEAENKIDGELNISFTQFDSQKVDSRAAAAFAQMKKAVATKTSTWGGQTLYLRSGYRSISTQRVNYNAAVARYQSQGKSKEEAVRLTNQYYTVPGHSEHHTGLAFDTITPEYHRDIYSLDDRFAKTDAYAWLVTNCADYGFILRYPKDKESITKINFEPWHYRYVGVEHAKYMKKYNLCLEEYIALLKEAGR